MNKNSLTKNALYKFALNFFNIILPVIVGPFILRVIGPTNLGKVQYVLNIMGYFLVFSTFGIYQYGLREVSKCREDKIKLNNLFSNLFIISIITSTITLVTYLFFITYKYKSGDIYFLLLIQTVEYITNAIYVEWVTEGLEQFEFITKKTIILRTAYAIFLILLLRNPDDYVIYAALLIVTNFLNNAISFVYIKRFVKFSFRNIKIFHYLSPLLYVLILNNANILYTQFDKTLLGPDNIVFFTTAHTIIMAVYALSNSLSQVIVPRISSIVEADNSQFLGLLSLSTKINLIFVIPMACGMMALSNEIVLLYAGNEYLPAVNILAVFGIYLIILIIDSIITNQVMYPNNKEKQLIKNVFLGGGFNVVVNLSLLYLHLFNGVTAVIVTTLANLIIVVLNYISVIKELNIRLSIINKDTVKYIITSLSFFVIAILFRGLLNSSVLIVLLTFLTSAVVYLTVLILTKDKTFILFLNKFGLARVSK